MRKQITLLLLFIYAALGANAQTFTTAANGNWNATTTWTGGVVPDANATSITLNHNVTVTADVTVPCALTVAASKTLTVNSGINFTVDFAQTLPTSTINTTTAKFLVSGTFNNNGNTKINGMLEVDATGVINQTLSAASLTIDGSDGTAAGSIPDGSILFNCVGTGGNTITAGTLTFLQPPYGTNSATLNLGGNFGASIASPTLALKFGGVGSQTNTLNTEGFVLKTTSTTTYNLRVGSFTIDNTVASGGSGVGQLVTLKNPNLNALTSIYIGDGELRAPGGTGYSSTIFFAGFFTNNAIVTSLGLSYSGSSGAQLDGTGVFRNAVTGSTASTTTLTINETSSIPYSIDAAGFNVNTLNITAGKFLLFNNDFTINGGHTNFTVTTPSTSSYLITAGAGKLKIKQAAATTINPGKLLPIGTVSVYAPITVFQLTAAGSAAEEFSYKASTLTGANNSSECHKVMWDIREATPGGNTSYYFTFQWNPTTDVGANFATGFNEVYNNPGTGWVVSNYNKFRFNAPSSTLNEWLSLNNLGNSERGLFTIACGKGLLASGKNIIGTATSGNWGATSSWVGGTVPTASDYAYVKAGHTVTLDVAAQCDGLNNSGTLNLNSNTLTVGPTNGGKSVAYSEGVFNIGNSTLNVNGELYKQLGSLTLNGGTINIDPNNGDALTSRTDVNGRLTNYLFDCMGTGNSITGSINFLDPLRAFYVPVNPFVKLTNTSTAGINYMFGDGLNSGTTDPNERFLDIPTYITSNDNLIINTVGESYNTYTTQGNINPKLLEIRGGSSIGSPNNYILYLNDGISFTNGGGGQVNWTTGLSQLFLQGNATISGVGYVYTNRLSLGTANTNLTVNNNFVAVANTNGVTFNGTSKIILGNNSSFYADLTSAPIGTGSYIVMGTNSQFGNYFNVPSGSTRHYPMGTLTSYTPISIQTAATHVSDYFNIKLVNNVLREGTTGSTVTDNVVNKTWDITEGTAGGSNVTVTVQWNAADESAGFDRANCYLTHYVASQWDVNTLGAATGTGPYTRSRSGITSFSPFAITSSTVSLPIQWLSVTAALNAQNKPVIQWKVQESNIESYTVQQSNNGYSFSDVSTVASQGNGTNEYSMIDASYATGTSYYKIAQKDRSGLVSYSKIVKVNSGNKNEISLNTSAATNNLQFSLNSTQLLGTTCSIIGLDGKVLAKQKITNVNNIVDVSNYATGMYLLRLDQTNKTYKFIKQ